MSTYENILRITDTLIQQRGFLGFSYADLEKEIGIRKASIHHHFPRKTDLGIAYCQYKTEVFDRLSVTKPVTITIISPSMPAAGLKKPILSARKVIVSTMPRK